jgi:hypothetical protein
MLGIASGAVGVARLFRNRSGVSDELMEGLAPVVERLAGSSTGRLLSLT